MSAPDERMRHDFERIEDAVRREVNLVERGLISGYEACTTILEGDLRLMAAEDLVVRRETADMDKRLAEWIGGAA